jgi:hypothetical protein
MLTVGEVVGLLILKTVPFSYDPPAAVVPYKSPSEARVKDVSGRCPNGEGMKVWVVDS